MADAPTNGAEDRIPDQSLIPPAQELTTFSCVSHDQPTLQTVTIELSGGTAFQLTSDDHATAVAATGNSQNYYSPESIEVHLPDQSLIPTAQELTTSGSSVSHDQPTLQNVTIELSGGNSFQPPFGYHATAVAATGNSPNHYILESPPDHVTIQMEHDHDPLQSGGQTGAAINRRRTTTSTAGSRHVTSGISNTGTNSIADQFFQLVSNFLGLAFQAAVALLIFKLQQPKSDSTPRSFLFNMVGATLICGFALTLMGMLLRRAHLTAANISGRAGVLTVAVGFFLVMGMYIPEPFHWLLWTFAGILMLTFAYFIAAPY